MISDAKIRAHLLSTFHGLRHSNDGWVPTSDMALGGMEAVHLARIRTICEQLAEAGLIKFKPLRGDSGAGIVGMSKITGHGSDVVEGLVQASIALDLASSPSTSVRQAAGPLVAGASADVPAAPGRDTTARALPSAEVKNAQPELIAELLTLRPSLWGISIDLKEAYRRLRRRFAR